MDIEYHVKNNKELKDLEEAMKALPCTIKAGMLEVTGTASPKTISITPSYGRIENIAAGEGVLLQRFGDDSSGPMLALRAGDYFYVINLKARQKNG